MTTQRKPIEAVVFDMGGVLTVDPYEAPIEYAIELGVPRRTFVDQLAGPRFHQVETGRLSMRDYLKFACTDVTSRFGVDVDIRRLAGALASGQRFRPEMADVVRELAAGGVPLALLTNNASEARDWWNSGVFPVEAFAVVVDSSEVGLRKPDPAIFAEVVKRLNCDAAAVLFFDDTEVNVAAATTFGMVAVLFEDPRQCRRHLLDHGLLAA